MEQDAVFWFPVTGQKPETSVFITIILLY